MTRIAVIVLCALLSQVFRSQTDAVTISASVTRGKQPVANLAPEDFRLTDNGVLQTLDVLTVESVPIDLTLFIDTSGSTAGVLGRMRKDVEQIAALLRASDRLRVLTIGVAVEESLPWQPAPERVDLEVSAISGISLIYDALFAGLAHRPDAGRRHLLIGLTDAQDCGSVIDGATLLASAARTEGVLHIVYAHSTGSTARGRVNASCAPLDPSSEDFIRKTAERTGGGMHTSALGDPAVREFTRILDEFRSSYVLRYSPSGVARAGWHAVTVEVPGSRDATVHARSGYFVDK